jgi:hypothetical protein
MVEEVRVAVLSSLLLTSTKWLVGLDDQNTPADNHNESMISAMVDLYGFLLWAKQTEQFRTLQLDAPLPESLTKDEKVQRLTELVRRAIPLLDSTDKFREFLLHPEQVQDTPENRFKIGPMEAKEFVLPEGEDLRGIYAQTVYENRELQATLESEAKRHAKTKEEAEELNNFVREHIRTNADGARTEVIEFEEYWFGEVRKFYEVTLGDPTERRMFEELYKEINDPQRQRTGDRGKTDVPFGEGKLFLSDLQHFFSCHWSDHFKKYFKPNTHLKNVRRILHDIVRRRNQLTHSGLNRTKREQIAVSTIHYIGEFNQLVCDKDLSQTILGED